GRSKPGISLAAPTVKAKADAACPDGNEKDVGRGISGPVRRRITGRSRFHTSLRGPLTRAEVTATESTPRIAARRARLPPNAAIRPAIVIQRTEWSAALLTSTTARSRRGRGRAVARWNRSRSAARMRRNPGTDTFRVYARDPLPSEEGGEGLPPALGPAFETRDELVERRPEIGHRLPDQAKKRSRVLLAYGQPGCPALGRETERAHAFE